jgi:RND family efflux transporter MFP subunit
MRMWGARCLREKRWPSSILVDYKLALKEAETNLRSARIQLSMRKKSYARANRLLPEKAITPELFDQAETAYQAAKTTVSQLETMLAMAKRRLDKTAIKTPFGGHVTARYVETGQNIAAGSPIMKIADMKAMRVKIYINELEYVHVDEDDPVTVTVEAFSKAPLTGRVDKIGIQADSRTNTFEVEILVDNPDSG